MCTVPRARIYVLAKISYNTFIVIFFIHLQSDGNRLWTTHNLTRATSSMALTI